MLMLVLVLVMTMTVLLQRVILEVVVLEHDGRRSAATGSGHGGGSRLAVAAAGGSQRHRTRIGGVTSVSCVGGVVGVVGLVVKVAGHFVVRLSGRLPLTRDRWRWRRSRSLPVALGAPEQSAHRVLDGGGDVSTAAAAGVAPLGRWRVGLVVNGAGVVAPRLEPRRAPRPGCGEARQAGLVPGLLKVVLYVHDGGPTAATAGRSGVLHGDGATGHRPPGPAGAPPEGPP